MGLFTPPAGASDLIPRRLPDLAHGATLIFLGRCEAISCHWNPDHSLILTANRFRILRSFKGAPGPTVTLEELGGTVGDTHLEVSDAPRYAVGEEVLLFVRRTPLGRWATAGAGQGRLGIVRDAHGRPWVLSDVYRRDLAAMASDMKPGHAPLAVFVGWLQATLKAVTAPPFCPQTGCWSSLGATV